MERISTCHGVDTIICRRVFETTEKMLSYCVSHPNSFQKVANVENFRSNLTVEKQASMLRGGSKANIPGEGTLFEIFSSQKSAPLPAAPVAPCITD